MKIKLDVSRLSSPLLLKRVRFYSECMDQVPELASDEEMKNELEAASTELDDAMLEQDLALKKVQQASERVQRARERNVAAAKKYVNKVGIIASTDPSLVQKAGLELVDTKPTRKTTIDPPMHLTLTESNGTGKLHASVKSMSDARTYIFQVNYDITNDKGWQHLTAATRSGTILVGLESGKRVWVRAAALGTVGQSDWSDVASRIVP